MSKQITVKAWRNDTLVYQRCHKEYLTDEGLDEASQASRREFERAWRVTHD